MRTIISTAIGITVTASLAFGLIASGAGGDGTHSFFKKETRKAIAKLEARVAVLEAQQADMDAGLLALIEDGGPLWTIDHGLAWVQDTVNREHPVIALTGITPEMTCDDTECTVTVEWSSDPPATGQVEWGLDESYGNLNGKEVRLLDWHRQTVGVFPFDTTIHFRILADIPGETPVIASEGSSIGETV